jgi:hypothetical protein
MMKHLEIPRLSPGALLERATPAIPLAEVNWPGDYPSCPPVHFRIAYDDTRFILAFDARETCFRASETEDNGRVWEDSCVEFFIQPGGEGGYYNFECNAIGTLLLAHGDGRHEREAAPREVLATIGRQARVEVTRDGGESLYHWSLLLSIPFTALFRHRFAPRPGESARGNFYKCGDKTARPHFLSWNPVDSATPDFHRPGSFGLLSFQT